MRAHWSSLAGVCALCVASAVVVAAGQPAGQAPLKLEAPKPSGGSVTGAFEGWFPNADGTFTLLVGYMNRNLTETLDIAIGPGNRIEPGGPDKGQPTHFSPRRQYGMFTLVVPKDFAATTKQLQWTLTANGQTTVIPLALHPEYQVDPQRDVSTGNTPPVLRFAKGGAAMQGPVKPLSSGGVGATYSGRVGQPVELRAFIADDMLADPGAVPGVPASGSAATEQPPLSVTWSKFRGPGVVSFKDARPPVAQATDGAATTTAVFSAAGDYVLRVAANDASGEGGGGFQCCWTSAYARVTVKP